MMEILFKPHKSKEDQFTEIYNQCFDYVYSFIYTRTAGNEKITEEIVQETFTAAWVSQDRFSHKSSYSTWICGIAKNKLYEYYRKKTTSEKHELVDNEIIEELSSSFNLEKIVLRNEESRSVIIALNNINTLYSYSLILKYIDDYTIKQIAQILARTPKAVDGILQRAKNSFIREYLVVSGKENEHGR
ncbi:MAG: polymerase sigma factor, sigma-70 family [Clostridiales bacterium]|jgi:RNA polymerase sigma-70 factor (ECF subfamily)|nr:polymerase sigma factor, sigma-70 family [Clostridiales bacterium]